MHDFIAFASFMIPRPKNPSQKFMKEILIEFNYLINISIFYIILGGSSGSDWGGGRGVVIEGGGRVIVFLPKF